MPSRADVPRSPSTAAPRHPLGAVITAESSGSGAGATASASASGGATHRLPEGRASAVSLRQKRLMQHAQQQHREQRESREHRRRMSADFESSAPITYFPPPSSSSTPVTAHTTPSAASLLAHLSISPSLRETRDLRQPAPTVGGPSATVLAHSPTLPSMAERAHPSHSHAPTHGKSRSSLSAASSPRREPSGLGLNMGAGPAGAGAGSGLPPPSLGLAEHRKGSVPRALSTPVPNTSTSGGGDVSGGAAGLGIGVPGPERRVHKDDALASPRRISTSRPAPSAYPRTALGLGLSTGGGAGAGGVSGGPSAGTSDGVNASPSHGHVSVASGSGAGTVSSLAIPSTTNEAYYSQPPSASTPRFRSTASLSGTGPGGSGLGYGALGLDGGLFPSTHGGHARQRSVTTLAQSPRLGHSHGHGHGGHGHGGQGHGHTLAPQSPAGSMLRRLRKTASAVGLSFGGAETYDSVDDGGAGAGAGWDSDEEEAMRVEEDEARRSNGTRVWYSSYVTIDWIHDQIKESSRVRRLRGGAKRSRRGAIANAWDRFQGWLVVTIVGIIAAIIAFLVIRTEMALFDLKEGFCTTSWGSPKRFCCAPGRDSDVGGACEDWVEWGEWYALHGSWLGGAGTGTGDASLTGGHGGWGHPSKKMRWAWVFGRAEFIAYAIIALLLASIASTLTIYLSSSEHHITSKDSSLLVPPARSRVRTPADSGAPSPTHRERERDGAVYISSLSGAAGGSGRKGTERQPLLSSPLDLPEGEGTAPGPPRKVLYYAAGSGIPEIKTILSGFVIHGYLGGWTLFTKSLGLALSVASGLSLGKEGPLVHISSCVGNIVSRLFVKYECNEAKRREILSAACAAGVSVAFGAPIGGVLFSLEEVSYYFPPKVMWRSFWCAAVAAITLKALNPFGNGSIVLWAVTYTKPYQSWEYAIFLLLGVFGGLYGALFSRLNITWARGVRQGTWVGRHPIVEVLLVTALTTVISFLNPYCRLGGTEFVASLFAECKHHSESGMCVDTPHEIWRVVGVLGTAMVIKGGLTIITFGIKLPAGIFIPSLVVGACFGRIAGLVMEWIEHSAPHLPMFQGCVDGECIVPGLYAMVGAAATLAGVTRTTVSLVVIMIELTGSLNYVVPIMLAVLLAKTVADGLEKRGIYDLVIELNQLPYLDSKHEYLWGSRVVDEVADRHVPVLRADQPHTVRSLTGRLLELARSEEGGLGDAGFPVLTRSREDVRRDRDRERERERESAGGKDRTRERERERGTLRVVGFLGVNELEHALSTLADEPDALLNLLPPEDGAGRGTGSGLNSIHSIFSFAESGDHAGANPYDLSRYIDRAPITVQPHSPLELVQQLFVKLGARQVMVVDGLGAYRGVVEKKRWLGFLADIEGEGH